MNKFLLLASVVIGVCIGVEDRCVWGPPYWCSSINHAKECRAVQHCMDTVWKHQTIQVSSTATCMYCQLVVGEVKDVLGDKQAEDEIGKIISEACNLLPAGDAQDVCKGIVSENIPILIQMFENKLSVDVICSTLGLCDGLKDTWSPYGDKANEITTLSPNNTCKDCTTFFKDVQDTITSQETLEELEQLINQTICSQLGPVSSVCSDLVAQYLPMGLQVLASQIDPDIVCRIFGFCGGDKHEVIVHMKNIFANKGELSYRSSEECDICKEFMTQIDDVIRDQTMQTKVKEFLEDNICGAMGGLTDDCKQIVEEYAPMLFELLVNELDPSTFCETIGLCTVPSKVIVQKGQPAGMVGQGYVKDSAECTFCKFIMQQVDTLLKKNETVQTFEDLIDKICKRLPGDLDVQCEQFVQEYGQLVINLLAQELDPKTICTEIKLCTGQQTLNGVLTFLKTKYSNDSGLCTVCQMLVTDLRVLLANVSQKEIVDLATMVCSYLPGNMSATCQKYVTEFGPVVIDLIKNGDPKTLCSMAKLCTSAQVPVKTAPVKTVSLDKLGGPSTECEVCDTLIIFLKSTLEQNATKEEVEAAVESLCTYLPSEIQKACKGFIEQYGDKVVDLILQKLDAHAICIELGLCKAGVESKVMPYLTIQQNKAIPLLRPVDTLPLEPIVQEKVSGDLECTVCKYVLDYIDKKLGENRTEAEIQQLLDEICTKVPASMSDECKSLVDTYGPVIINYLVLKLSPTEICQKISMCPAGAVAHIKPMSKPVHVNLLKDTHVNKVGASGAFCVICEFVMKEVDSMLKGNKSEEAITEALEKVCSILPSTISAECTSFVDQYSKLIINLIVNELANPDQVCQLLSLCSASDLKLWSASVKLLDSTVNADLCVPCKLVVTELENFLKENRTTGEIEDFLKSLCDKLPDTVTVQCHDVIDQYVPAILDLLEQNLKPTEVCQTIGLCPKTKAPTAPKDDDTLFFKPAHKQELLGANECTYGPSYWCATRENAEKCHAIKHCMNHVWN